MKRKCNVARDLMPLVIDGVASEDSQQYVDEHIAECTECALTYGAMRVHNQEQSGFSGKNNTGFPLIIHLFVPQNQEFP